MEKSIIPVLLDNKRLNLVMNEIINIQKDFNNFRLNISSKKNLSSSEKNILILDDMYFEKDNSIINGFKQVYFINTLKNDIKIDEPVIEIIKLETPFRIRDVFDRISKNIDQNMSQIERRLKFSEFEYDQSMRILSNNKLSLRFTEKESQIFQCLLDNSNNHLSRKHLLRKVWKYDESIDTHTLETHIYSLRKKIESKLLLKDLIIFVENKGYLLDKSIL